VVISLVQNGSVRKVLLWLSDQVRPFLKFGAVGIVALLVDIGLFNAILQLEGAAVEDSYLPLIAKVCSVSVSTIVAWLGNRWWTFRSSRHKRFLLELLEYALVALGGMAIAVTCLWISHYLLGFTSILADNISANVVGLVFATAFRYLLNRYWVFHEARSHHAVT
jgi:putative flippase GtrA